MSVEFWLSYNNNAERLRLPVNPSGISVSSPYEITDVEVTHLGEYSVFGERGLKEISFESFFPSEYNSSYCEYSEFPSPIDCVAILEEWRDKKKPIRLVVTGTNINIAVTIRSLDLDYERAGEMGDIYYSINLKEYRFIPNSTVIDVTNAATPSQQKAEQRPAPVNKSDNDGARTYTVKSGDSLSKVFGNNWRKVYEANKDVIGSNPNIIRPGQKLVVPQ